MPEEKAQLLDRLRLVAITDDPAHHAAAGQGTARDAAIAQALAAGLPALMLREGEGSDATLRPVALRLRVLTREARALFIMNRRPDLAREVGADGIHVGTQGVTIAEARAALPDGLVGYSAHSAAEALQAFAAGADYIFLSPIFDTPSKQGILAPLGIEPLAELCRDAPGPVLALGGIDATNIARVAAAGAHGAAMIRGVWDATYTAQDIEHLLGIFSSKA